MAADITKTIGSQRVLLTGASSQIGVFAIPRLLAAGFRVIAVSRKGKPEDFAEHDSVEWLTPVDAQLACPDCQYLLSAGPLQLARQFLQQGRHFQTAVIFSSSSIFSKLASPDSAERQLIQEMREIETDLMSLADSREFRLMIFRPTLIYGCGLDTNISRLAGLIRRFGFMPVNGRASGLRQPVHADDLSAAAVNALLCDVSLPREFVLAGGSTLSYADMVGAIFMALDKPARLVRLPEWLLVSLISVFTKAVPGLGLNSEMVKRQLIDLVFDDSEARELLDYNPRPFAPTEADFQLPTVSCT